MGGSGRGSLARMAPSRGAVRRSAPPMRVLAVNQFYLPDHSATAQLLGELCEDLATAGHEVDVITSRGTYLGGRRLPRTETRRGVVVHRTFSTSLGKKSIAHRLADYATFWSSAIFRAMVSRKPNVVLALTTPPMIALGMAQVARARSVPLVTWNQDVYPETAAELGVLSRSGTVYRTLQRMARRTHQLATRVIALSQGMADRLLEEGAGADKVRVIPLGIAPLDAAVPDAAPAWPSAGLRVRTILPGAVR